MKPGKIILASIAGTSAMTVFSYIVSARKKKNFREPELLSAIMEEPGITKKEVNFLPAGWAAHYTAGMLFVLAYNRLFNLADIRVRLKNGILLGGISGLIGALTWKLVFTLHPDPPVTDYKSFYRHLVIAHIIFGATVILAMRYSNLDRHTA
jgi:hypothetical protein